MAKDHRRSLLLLLANGFARKLFPSCGTTEIRCVRFHKGRIEIVLTNQQAQLVTLSRLAVA
jgi:hypothetical protein